MFVNTALRTKPLENQEEIFLENIRNGDAKSFESMFRQYYQSMFRYAFSILKKSDEAEDLVQQVFVNFWEKRELTIISGSLKNYLFRSVHNQCLNQIKHEKVKQGHQNYALYFETHYHFMVEENFQASELEGKIEEAMDLLPTECRRIFRMSRVEELKYAEIATQLQLSIKTVENQIGKALKILRVALAEYLISILLILLAL